MKNLYTCLLVLLSMTLTAQNEWSLADCINYAKEHNIEVLKQEFQNESIEKDITIAKGNYYPDLNFNAFQGFNLGNSFDVSTGVGQLASRSNSFSLSSSVNLFSGFRNKYKVEQVELMSEKGEKDLEKLAFDLSLIITNHFLQVLFNKEILALAKEQEKISQQEVNRLKQLVEAALKPKSDLLEMESALALDRKEIIIAENNINNRLIDLKKMLDIKTIDDFDIKAIDLEELEKENLIFSKENIYQKALKINPLLKSTQLSLAINEKNILLSKSALYPKLLLNYSFNSNYFHIRGQKDLIYNQATNQFDKNGFFTQLGNNRTHYIGISAMVPIFNKFQATANIEKSKIALKITQVELVNQQEELKYKIEMAYNDVLTAKATLEASRTALLFQEEAFAIAQKKYKEGFITSYEFLDRKSRLMQTQSELIKAKYDYLFKIKLLMYYEH